MRSARRFAPGEVQVEATPRSWASAIGIMADLTIAEILPPGFWQRRLPSSRAGQPVARASGTLVAGQQLALSNADRLTTDRPTS